MKRILFTFLIFSLSFSTISADDTFIRKFQRYRSVLNSFFGDYKVFMARYDSMPDYEFIQALMRSSAYIGYLFPIMTELTKVPKDTFTTEQWDLIYESRQILYDIWVDNKSIFDKLNSSNRLLADEYMKQYLNELERGAVTLK